MKKIFFRLLIINILPLSLYAAGYVPLVEIEGITSSSATNYTDLLVQYAKGLYRMGVGLAAALAVMMLIFGGFEYATTDAIGGKEEGKEKIRNAIGGLLLALFSFLILQTIDQRLINLNLDLGDDVVIVAGEYPDILNNPNFEEQDDYSAGPGPGDTPPEGANGTKVNIPAGIRVDS